MARPAWDVKQARETAGYHQIALDRFLGLPDRTFDRIERSLITSGSTATADAIIAALPTLPTRAQFELRSLLRRKQSHWLAWHSLGSGNYVSTPDAPLIGLTGDLDVRWRVNPDSWIPGAIRTICGKYDTNAQRSWRVFIGTNGKIQYAWSVDGVTPITAVPSSATGYTDGRRRYGRCTHDVDNGAAGTTVQFYDSLDGVTWTPTFTVTGGLGGPTTRNIGTAPLTLGAFLASGSPLEPLIGNLDFFELRNGINGPVVARFDAQNVAVSAPKLPTTTAVEPINLFSANEASVESSLPALFAGESATGVSSWDNTTAYDGTSSVLLTAATPSGGRASFDVHPAGPPSGYFAVTPGQAYTFISHVKGLVATKTSSGKINWSNAAGQFLTSTGGTQQTNSLAAWTTLVTQATAPAGAVRGGPGCDLRGTVNGDAANFDGFAFFVGTESDWRPPGDVWTMNGAGWSWIEVAA